MTCLELSKEYRKSAHLLSGRIAELKSKAAALLKSSEEKYCLDRRITELEYIMAEMTGIARRLEDYAGVKAA